MPSLFSYVVDHDVGIAPHAWGKLCTLCKCKFGVNGRKNIVELAEVGDWIVGTGGAKLKCSAGHGKMIYAMRVDEVVPLQAYCERWNGKRTDAGLEHHYGERRALISRHFYYFGREAILIPKRFRDHPLEKKGPGFRRDFDAAFIQRFARWLECSFAPGIHGKPCQPREDYPMRPLRGPGAAPPSTCTPRRKGKECNWPRKGSCG